MTTSDWPDLVFELGGAVDGVSDANEVASVS